MARMLAAVLMWLTVLGCAWGQIDPALYALSHQLSIIQGPSTRQAGRGGAGVALAEAWGGNPAALQAQPAVGPQYHLYSFENGMEVTLVSIATAYPTGRWNFVLSWAEQNGTQGSLPIPGLSLDLHESDLSVQIGYRVNDRMTLGAGAAPAMDVRMRVSSPLGPMAEISSKPLAGYRVGGLWEVGDGWSVGGFYDNYLESVWLRMVGYPAVRHSYRSEIGRYGIAKREGPWLLVADHYQGRIYGAPSEAKCDNWLYGVDCELSSGWTVRGGSFNRQPSAGFTYRNGDLVVDYAYVKNIFDDDVHALLGGSSTHALMLSYGF